MNIFVIEDEPLSVERLENQLKEIDNSIEIRGTADSIETAVAWLRENTHPDLILMDIELADGQSFEIFKQVEIICPVIFTTSYDEYTLDAFKVNGIDYLLKPIKKEELKQGIEKLNTLKNYYVTSATTEIEKLVASINESGKKQFRSRFLVKYGRQLISIETVDIAYFFIEGRLTFFRTWDNKKFVTDYSLDELSGMLRTEEFFRVNRGYFVNIKCIKEIHIQLSGKIKLELTPGPDKDVIISRENASAFKVWLGR